MNNYQSIRNNETQDQDKTDFTVNNHNNDYKEFAYIVSHDLKKPLRGISNYSQFLLEDYEGKISPEADKMLHKLASLSKQAQHMVDLVYAYACVDQVDTKDEIINLQELLHNLVKDIDDNKNQTLSINIHTDMPNLICNHSKISEVFYHLINNAVIYNDKPLKNINISYDYERQTFLIEDNGVGIDLKDQDQLFNMFKRGYNKNIQHEGEGIGLSMVKRIIEYYNGEIWLDSTPLVGTKVYFKIPDRIKNN